MKVARLFQETIGSRVSVLDIAEDAGGGQPFLEEWVADHGLSDAKLLAEAGEVETAIGFGAVK